MAGKLTARIDYEYFDRWKKERVRRTELIDYNSPGEVLDYLMRQIGYNDANNIHIVFEYKRID